MKSTTRARSRRTLAIVLAALALLLAGGGVLAWRLVAAARAPVGLRLVIAAGDAAQEQAVREALGEFSSLYPRITVALDARDGALLRGQALAATVAGADAATATGALPVGTDPWASPPSPWSGPLWVLAARRSVLDRQADLAESIASLRAGTLAPAGFEALLGALKDRGVVPIAIGNSHGWPFVTWLQHWAAATVGVDAVSSLPAGPGAQSAEYLERLRTSYGQLAAWKVKGWFDRDAWGRGWAQGLRALSDGRAAFALVSAPLLTAIPEAARADLEFVPFPGSRGAQGGTWTIGSVTVLGVVKGTRHAAEAALLVRYLTSPGVTRVLSRRLARPFFAWDPGSGAPPAVIADWYGALNTPQYQVLLDAFGSP